MAKSNSVGTTLKIGTASVGSLKSISGIDESADTIDVTDLGNSTGYRDFLPGFKDGGEVSVSGFFDGSDAGQQALETLFQGGGTETCKIVFPSAIGKTWSFTAGCTKYTTGASVDDAVTFEATLKVSGQPILAASTP